MSRSDAIIKALNEFDSRYDRAVLSIYVTNHNVYYDILIKSRDKHKKIYENNFVIWKNVEKVEEDDDA